MDALLAVETIEELDFDAELKCEGSCHDRGLYGHVPDSPGAFAMCAPCCGFRIIICAPRRAAFEVFGLVHCPACQIEHLVEQYTFVPVKS